MSSKRIFVITERCIFRTEKRPRRTSLLFRLIRPAHSGRQRTRSDIGVKDEGDLSHAEHSVHFYLTVDDKTDGENLPQAASPDTVLPVPSSPVVTCASGDVGAVSLQRTFCSKSTKPLCASERL